MLGKELDIGFICAPEILKGLVVCYPACFKTEADVGMITGITVVKCILKYLCKIDNSVLAAKV